MDRLDKLLILYKSNIKKVLISDMVPDYMEEFDRQYNFYFERYAFASYDKTAPSLIKDDILHYVKKSIVDAITSMDERGEMVLSAIDLDVFSRPGAMETDSLRLFYFYLHGTPGMYVSISQEIYGKLFGSSKKKSRSLGRFGTMFMMKYSSYEKLYTALNGAKRGLPSPSSIKHPFSGAPPVRIFELVWEQIEKQFDKYTKKAMALTTKS